MIAMIAAEYEATQMYVQLAESTDNKLAVAVLKDIADEEIVHAGEFLSCCTSLLLAKRRSMTMGRKRWKRLESSNFRRQSR
jgi:rubrerythrin